MPIKWKSKFGFRGRISITLANATSSISGTMSIPETFRGAITGLIYDFTGTLTGVFQALSARTGVISAALANWTSNIYGIRNSAPKWVDSNGAEVGTTISVSIPAGSAVNTVLYDFMTDARGHWYDADGDALTVTMTGTPPTGTTYNPKTKQLTVTGALTPLESASITTTADDGYSGATAESDWLARSQGAGVVWAHRFDSPTAPGLFWGLSPTNFTANKRTGYVGPGVTRVGVEGMTRYAEGVIPGTGCLEQYTPANVTIGNMRWARPLAPTTGAMAVPAQNIGGGITTEAYTPSSTAAVDMDINNAGWPRFDYKTLNSSYVGDGWNKINGAGGGKICNPSDLATYQRTIPAVAGRHPAYQEITAAPADGYYIQYRVKFPVFPNGDCLLDYTQGSNTALAYRGAWQGKSWLMHSFGDSDYFHEIGMMFKGYSPNAASGYRFDFGPLIYGHREDWQYTNGVQANITSGPVQGDYSMVCSYQQPSTCWKPTRNRWITILVHVIPGSQNIDDRGDINAWLAGTYGTLTRDQTVEMWVADEGATSYTKLLTSTGYASYYSGRYSLNGQTKNLFGFGDQYFGTSNSGGDLLITPETNCDGIFTGCEMEFMQGAVASLPSGIPSSTKVYAVMVGTTAFKVATTRANALAGTPVVLPYVNGGTDVAPNRNRVGFSCAPGYSMIQFLQQMNLTSSNSPYEKPSWILYDQIICSTQPILCPAV